MSLSETRTGELLGLIAAGCDRLVNRSVTHAATRLRDRRFIGMVLAAPFLAAWAMAILFPPQLGSAVTLALVAVAFGVGLLLAGLTHRGRSGEGAEILALASATIVAAGVTAAAGGMASPAALIIAALPFEAWWLKRSRRALVWGGCAALAVIPLQAWLGAHVFSAPVTPGPAHWLLPLAYAAFAGPRIVTWFEETMSAQRGNDNALEDMLDAVILRVTTAGEVVDASAKSRGMLGLAPELLLADGLFDRVHVADRVAYLCALADMRHGNTARHVELKLRFPSLNGNHGDYRPFSVEMMRASEADPIVTMVVRRNDEVHTLRDALAASADSTECLELAKSRFLATVSHELRTPLNAIIGFSDMLLHEIVGGFKDPRQKEYVSLVRDSGQHLLSVVNSILDVSRIESGTYATAPELFRFADAADMCRSMLGHQASIKKLDFTMQIAPEIGDVRADKRAVQQILINLVSNAIKFTPEGGRIMIGASRIGSRLHFWVSDSGIGMTEEDLACVGKPFVQVQNDYTRRFEGTGLGLSLVKGLVELHQGTMSIESESGRGTTVTIGLPADGPAKIVKVEPSGVSVISAWKSKEDMDGAFRKTA